MRKICLLLALFSISLGILAQEDVPKKFKTYNYLRGMECMEEEDYSTAINFFEKDIAENPKNGYSHFYLSLAQGAMGEYGEALKANDKAIVCLPKKDTENLNKAYALRAQLHLELEDTVAALDDMAMAIKINPKDAELYQDRGQIYYEQGRYDLSDADYQKSIDLDPNDVVGYMGIGRNANKQKHWDEAIALFDKVEKLSNDYTKVYTFRAESYLGQKKYNEAIDDIINYVEKEQDYMALFTIAGMDDTALSVARTKLKLKTMQNPGDSYWPYYLAHVEQKMGDFKSAIVHYQQSDENDGTNGSLSNIIGCCTDMGDYQRAMEFVDNALAEDSTNTGLIGKKIDVLIDMGKYEEAEEWAEKLFQDGDSYTANNFYIRGFSHYKAGHFEAALEDYNMGIADDADLPYLYFQRARLHEKMGNSELAKADYAKIVELEKDSTDFNVVPYAYLALGDRAKAVESLEVMLRADNSKGNLYDACCLYSLMGEKDKAIDYLEQSFEKGWRSFIHMENDSDLDNIRDTERYKALVEKYKALLDKELSLDGKGTSTENKESTVSEVPFTKEGGVCKVKCQINGLPLHFVFDTGASDVSISMVEANFMLKNGYLSSSDVVGRQRYLDANGNVAEGTIINIKKVNFGGLDLTNVRASVVRNQKAPLLLGQSVLAKLGKIEIDNSKKVLRITH